MPTPLGTPAVSASQHYHQFTKYSPEGLARHRHQLDWGQQPQPFKEYPLGVGAALELKPYIAKTLAEILPYSTDPGSVLQRLSVMLLLSYGITAIVPYPGQPLLLRSAPSAGGLYPAEIYLISKGVPELPRGLYNYQIRDHTLVRFWDESRWDLLQAACFGHPALMSASCALVTTAVFYRSAWRYEDRAYRRVCLDTGHLLGNIQLAASFCGWQAPMLGGFSDERVAELLFLDLTAEGPLTVIPLLEAGSGLDAMPAVLASPVVKDIPELVGGQWLPYLHQITQLPQDQPPILRWTDPEVVAGDKYNFPFCLKVTTPTPPIEWGSQLGFLIRTILERRSTRQYTGEGLELGDLLAMLDFTYHSEHYRDQGLLDPSFFDLSLIETFVVANGVNGLEAGCYYYAPHAQELRQIRFRNFRREVHHLCLGQELGRDAGAIVFHTADLQQAVKRYGDRVYRYLHMDAGHLGQRLNLAAIRLGLGVSGIAGFFDDQVNEVLGIPETEAVLYITTLGIPMQRPDESNN